MIIEKTYKEKGRKKQEIKKSKIKNKKNTGSNKSRPSNNFQPGSGSKHQNYSVRECSENVLTEKKPWCLFASAIKGQNKKKKHKEEYLTKISVMLLRNT